MSRTIQEEANWLQEEEELTHHPADSARPANVDLTSL